MCLITFCTATFHSILVKKNNHNTGVINDPLDQTHGLASSDRS